MVRAARATGRERHSRVVRLMPDSASRGGSGRRTPVRSAMSASARPRTSRWYHDPFVRWTSGSFVAGTRAHAERERAMAIETRELPKAYIPGDFESGIYARWLAADVFAPDGKGSRADQSKPA